MTLRIIALKVPMEQTYNPPEKKLLNFEFSGMFSESFRRVLEVFVDDFFF